ncbi:hypothetical protein OG413_42215 [Streptomyces sp. NBC_01433]|nr:hypothetical protein [Streptomyces sp. NBC_01433]MCX4681822.1 hypothetical protein [Streptomyces sp. NBC_01433]
MPRARAERSAGQDRHPFLHGVVISDGVTVGGLDGLHGSPE